MGIFDIFKKKKQVSRDELSELTELIVNNTFTCEAFLSTYPITEQYLSMLEVIKYIEEAELDVDDADEFSIIVKDMINVNTWSEVKQSFRSSTQEAADTCISLPSNVIKAIAEGIDNQVAPKFLPQASQLEAGSKHIAGLILTPYSDNVLPAIQQLQNSQKQLKQNYEQFHKGHTSLLGGFGKMAESFLSGVMLASGNPIMMAAGGTKLAKNITADAPESRYIEVYNNYLESLDEYHEFDKNAYEAVCNKTSELAKKQAIPLIEKYIDTALKLEAVSIEHCFEILESISQRTVEHYKQTPAETLFDTEE
ncbi:hypothetical protein [Vibrio cortegadensis]|uniref:Uncharacterized protein n=1 Tax=Vibrio cortegadensis TaxID=1328770 RepID=A0ABV4M9N7_9VIBR